MAASKNPSGPKLGSYRVVRGGFWLSSADDCRSACRDFRHPSLRTGNLGFRLSRTGPWRSHPLTLSGEQLQKDDAVWPTEPKEYQPYERFRDRFLIVCKDGHETFTEAPEMVYLPNGTFQMGDKQGCDNEKPVHLVRLDAFAIGRTPVTWREYRKFCEATDTHWPEWLRGESGGIRYYQKADYYGRSGVSRGALDLPIVGVSWHDTRAYCHWLSEQTGKTYSLPTEAQWEYACRAGEATRWFFGDNSVLLAEYAWFSSNAEGRLHPVRQKQPNPWGLYDIYGDVLEWCADWYDAVYYQKLKLMNDTMSASQGEQLLTDNPSGPEVGSYRVVRGGTWGNDASHCRSAYRVNAHPSNHSVNLGFRLSRSV